MNKFIDVGNGWFLNTSDILYLKENDGVLSVGLQMNSEIVDYHLTETQYYNIFNSFPPNDLF